MTLETNTDTETLTDTIGSHIKDVIDNHVNTSATESKHANEVADELLSKVSGDINQEEESPDNAKSDSIGGSANAIPNNNENAASPNAFSGMKDTAGQFFDASIHYLDEHGLPKRTPSGKFRRKRGGSSNTTAKTPVNPGVNNIVACQAAGRATADSIIMLGTMLFGSVGLPVTTAGYNEREVLQQAWIDYYIATGAITLPPWLMVTVATAGYAIPRFSNAEVQMRLYMMYQGIRNMVSPNSGGNKGSSNGTQANSGDDGKR